MMVSYRRRCVAHTACVAHTVGLIVCRLARFLVVLRDAAKLPSARTSNLCVGSSSSSPCVLSANPPYGIFLHGLTVVVAAAAARLDARVFSRLACESGKKKTIA